MRSLPLVAAACALALLTSSCTTLANRRDLYQPVGHESPYIPPKKQDASKPQATS